MKEGGKSKGLPWHDIAGVPLTGQKRGALHHGSPCHGSSRACWLLCAEGAKALLERKGLTMKERLKICQQTERRRITFGKVSHLHPFAPPL